MPYRNPIIPGHNPDPTIIKDGPDYFLITSTFEYFPALPIYRSTDLINWKLESHALDRKSQLNMRTVESGGGIFAPSLRKWRGRYYLACTVCYRVPNMENFHKGLIGPRGFYVWTDDIRKAGSWSEPVYFDTCGIDQDLFFDDDDRVYLSMTTLLPPHLTPNGFGIGVYVLEIDLTTGRSLTRPKLIRQSPHGSGVAEGSHIFKKDGTYYLLTAEGGTEQNHQEWIFSSTSGPFGPWVEPPKGVNPILYNGDHAEIQQTGHLDLVQGDEGKWWTVFLGTRNGRYDEGKGGWSQLGRETFLAPAEWKDGWPVINGGKPISIEGNDALVRSKKDVQEEYPFQPAESLPLSWYFLRTPMAKDWSLDARPGSLALYGTPYTIDVDESPAAVFQKQTAFTGTWTVKLDFNPEENEEAGVVVWWSRSAYASLSKVHSPEGPQIKVKWRPVDAESFSIEHLPLTSNGEIEIRVDATPTHYAFSFKVDEGEWKPVKEFTADCIIRKAHAESARNVGTHFGLFAQGTSQWPCLKSAFFRDVKWTGEMEGDDQKSLKRSLSQ